MTTEHEFAVQFERTRYSHGDVLKAVVPKTKYPVIRPSEIKIRLDLLPTTTTTHLPVILGRAGIHGLFKRVLVRVGNTVVAEIDDYDKLASAILSRDLGYERSRVHIASGSHVKDSSESPFVPKDNRGVYQSYSFVFTPIAGIFQTDELFPLLDDLVIEMTLVKAPFKVSRNVLETNENISPAWHAILTQEQPTATWNFSTPYPMVEGATYTITPGLASGVSTQSITPTAVAYDEQTGLYTTTIEDAVVPADYNEYGTSISVEQSYLGDNWLTLHNSTAYEIQSPEVLITLPDDETGVKALQKGLVEGKLNYVFKTYHQRTHNVKKTDTHLDLNEYFNVRSAVGEMIYFSTSVGDTSSDPSYILPKFGVKEVQHYLDSTPYYSKPVRSLVVENASFETRRLQDNILESEVERLFKACGMPYSTKLLARESLILARSLSVDKNMPMSVVNKNLRMVAEMDNSSSLDAVFPATLHQTVVGNSVLRVGADGYKIVY